MMRKLYTARDAMEAHFLRGLLENEGIAGVVQGELLATARGDLPMTQETLPSVWVRDEDLEQAQSIAATLQTPQAYDSAQPSWNCPACGEVVEGQFTDCWNCGAPRPD